VHHTLRLVQAMAAIVAIMAPALARAGRQTGDAPPPPPPPICRIGGVKVGVDSWRTLRSRHGKGAETNDGRGYAWEWRAAKSFLTTVRRSDDADTGPVKCCSLVSSEGRARQEGERLPGIHGMVRELGWMGSLIPGATEKELLAATRALPAPEVHSNERIWRMAITPAHGSPPPTCTRWAAVVRLEGGKVVSIRVAAQ
jgi:hypothetical protein